MSYNVADYLDLTLLNPLATAEDHEKLVSTAIDNSIYAICVNSNRVSLVKKLIGLNNVAIASVVGFPSGSHNVDSKLAEANAALLDGATEIDMVVNLSNIKEKYWVSYVKEIEQIKKLMLPIQDSILKIIIETALLTDEEIISASKFAVDAGADYVKTSTGFAKGGGANINAVSLMLRAVGGKAKIKASGGIRSFQEVCLYLDLGVSRIGASNINVLYEGYKQEDAAEY